MDVVMMEEEVCFFYFIHVCLFFYSFMFVFFFLHIDFPRRDNRDFGRRDDRDREGFTGFGGRGVFVFRLFMFVCFSFIHVCFSVCFSFMFVSFLIHSCLFL